MNELLALTQCQIRTEPLKEVMEPLLIGVIASVVANKISETWGVELVRVVMAGVAVVATAALLVMAWVGVGVLHEDRHQSCWAKAQYEVGVEREMLEASGPLGPGRQRDDLLHSTERAMRDTCG